MGAILRVPLALGAAVLDFAVLAPRVPLGLVVGVGLPGPGELVALRLTVLALGPYFVVLAPLPLVPALGAAERLVAVDAALESLDADALGLGGEHVLFPVWWK